MTESQTRRSIWKELLAGALLTVFVMGLAIAAAPPDAMGGWFGRGGFGGHHHGDWSADPERLRRHAELITEFVLDEVDATPEQTEKVTEIVIGFAQEMSGLRALHSERRELLLAELSRPEISRESIQTLRAQEMASLDALSQKLVDAVVDAAAVLTPEQRASLIEHVQEMHDRHGRHGH